MAAKKTAKKKVVEKPRVKASSRRCRTCNWWHIVQLGLPYDQEEVDPMTLRQECRGGCPVPSNKMLATGGVEPYRAWSRTDPDDGERCRIWEPREK